MPGPSPARRGLPHVLSFTVEPDGRLPNGQPLHEALAETEAETGGGAVFCRVNCARPVHLARELSGTMRARIGGIRAHASRLSYAGMDESTTLGDGDPVGFRPFCATFARYLPNLRLAAGCCGSDHRHVGKPCRHLHAHAEGQPVHMHQATCRRLRTTSGAKACF